MAQRWYVLHVHSGFEKKVELAIREQFAKKSIAEQIDQILVPTEQRIEVRRGTKHNIDHKLMPGYVLIHMEMSDLGWHIIKNTPKVTGFLGGKGLPVAISDTEAAQIMKQVKEGTDRPKSRLHFEVGEQVRVSDGPFSAFNGLVEEVDEERSRLKVAVSIFGRSTPVELEYTQVEKV
ncbi:MAG: transcription termination/antitermination protein NusG [Candidatus Pacebacteria bacterium]|nr:transcription termination/antitermination protein NusG [Candidatus Paceibacterota bacterium]